VYNKVLAAIDLIEGPARQVLAAAQTAVKSSGATAAQLSVVHVVEPQYVQYSFDPTFTGALTHSLEQEAIVGAVDRVAKLCEPFGIGRNAQHVVLGRAADQIHEVASAQHADLVVIGSHGYHGWRRLLGSTASAVLHGTPVDVLVVRIHND